LTSINHAFTAASVALDEAGRNDLIVLTQKYDPITQKANFAIEALYNNWYNDAFFLKVLGTTQLFRFSQTDLTKS